MNSCTQRFLDALESHGCRPMPSGRGFTACCPAHDDRTASLKIDDGKDGNVLVYCHARCKFKDIVEAVGLKQTDLFPQKTSFNSRRRIVAEYDYTDAHGELLFQAVRFEPKGFSQRRPDGKDWIWNLKGVRRVLYRLPELLKADPGRAVFVVEGEKDVDRLRDLDLVATCCPMGVGKWSKVDHSPLYGRRVLVIPDNDDPGREHAKQVVSSLDGRTDVTVIILPEISKHGDVSDWLDAGGTVQQLKQLVRAAL